MPEVIFVRASPTAEEERISLIKPNVDLNYLLANMPNILNSGGESYIQLYQHVRPFCSDTFKVCQLIKHFQRCAIARNLQNMEPVNLTKVS